MGAIAQRIPSFLGGVSQQPDSLKQPGQAVVCNNYLPDITFGLKRRPGMRLVDQLANASSDGVWFNIVETSTEKFFGQFSAAGELRIWDAQTGVEKTVNTPTTQAKAYIAGVAREDFDVLQVNDYNFVLNRTKVTGTLSTTSTVRDPEAFIQVNGVGYDTKYNVYINNNAYTYTTPATGNISIQGTITGIITALPPGWTGAAVGNGFTLRPKAGGILTFDNLVAGSGYTDGTYTDVVLTGGSGSLNKVDITVAGGVVTTVTVKDAGYGYKATDTLLTIANTEIGGTGSGFTIDVATVGTEIRDFTVDADGGVSGSAITAYKGSVPNVSRLPVRCEDGFVFKVANLEGDIVDDYYVKFIVDGDEKYGAGVWEETVKPAELIYLDPDTMPHVVIHEANDTFTFRSLNEADKAGEDLYWVERRVGDLDTNPWPSFNGYTISGITFYKNRLILLSEGNVLASQPGSFFNFFRNSALVATDADAVDLSCGSLRPVKLKYAIPDQGGLVIFSEHAQFILNVETGAEQFSASTASVKRYSTFSTNPNIEPVDTGESIVFCDLNQSYSTVTEMSIPSANRKPQTADLSKTNPNLIPSDLRLVDCSPDAHLIIFLSASDPKKMYLFKYFSNGGNRVLASWFTWDMPCEVEHFFFHHSDLYVVTNCNNNYVAGVFALDSDTSGTKTNSLGAPWNYRLDFLDTQETVTYDEVSDETKVYLSISHISGLNPVVVVDVDEYDRGRVYYFTDADVQTDVDGDYVLVPGDFTGADSVTIGYQFESRITLPRFYVKQTPQPGTVRSDTVNIPRVTRIEIESTDSGPYTATISNAGRPDRSVDIPQVIANQYNLNTSPLPSVQLNTIPVMGKGTEVNVSLYTATPFPVSFVTATWYGIYSDRGIRTF